MRSLTLEHTALYFTQDEDYALGAGPRICEVQLKPEARVLVATERSRQNEQLRAALLRVPVAKECAWLRSEAEWVGSWSTGDALRFAGEESVLRFLASRGFEALRRMAPAGPEELLREAAMHNVTRGWIEAVTNTAHRLGFDAVQGYEIDRHAGTTKPIARSWLAVMNAAAISPPSWRP